MTGDAARTWEAYARYESDREACRERYARWVRRLIKLVTR